jgi:hypothetical protein
MPDQLVEFLQNGLLLKSLRRASSVIILACRLPTVTKKTAAGSVLLAADRYRLSVRSERRLRRNLRPDGRCTYCNQPVDQTEIGPVTITIEGARTRDDGERYIVDLLLGVLWRLSRRHG